MDQAPGPEPFPDPRRDRLEGPDRSGRLDRPYGSGRSGLAAAPFSPLSGRRARRSTASPWALTLEPTAIIRMLWLIAVSLVVLDVLASIGAAKGAPYSLTHFFDGDDKTNVPTAFKTTMMLALVLLLFALRSLSRWEHAPFEPGWRLLAWVAVFAFVDESTYLHQTMGHVLHDHFHTSGVLRFAWVVLYVPVLAAVGVMVLRYIRFMPGALRARLLLGGVVYGVGAVAMEPLKSKIGDSAGEGSLSFKLVSAVSDSLELIGLTMLVAVLLLELTRLTSVVQLRFSTQDRDAGPAPLGIDLRDPVDAQPGTARR